MARSRLHKRYKRKYRRNPSDGPKANPPLASDIWDWIGPGFAAFAATRFLTRIVAVQVAKRKPSLGKHAGAIASAASFAASWFLANRVKMIAKYQMPLIVGSGIAAAQSLVQLYIPKLGVLVADATPQLAAPKMVAPGIRAEDLRVIDDEDPDEYVYNDSFDAGRQDATQNAADAAAATSARADDLDDLDLSDIAGSTQNMGIFGGN